eukprot:g10018.t1
MKYRALVLQLFKNEVVDVEVTEVNKLGFFAELGPARIFVSKSMVPEGWSYSEDDASSSFVSADGTKVIRRGSDVRVRLVATKQDQNRLNAIGTTMGLPGVLLQAPNITRGFPLSLAPFPLLHAPMTRLWRLWPLLWLYAKAQRNGRKHRLMRSQEQLAAVAVDESGGVECTWSDWSAWSYCSASCGEGLQTRKRWVAIAAQGGVQNCDGSSEQRQSCETPCAPGQRPPVRLAQDWSECTASCGGGWHQRVRALSASSNRTECNMAAGHQEEPCRETPCVSCWSEWSTCSQSCSGLRTRRNKASCPSASQEELCNVEACDCVLSDWSEWGLCSGPCHEGQAVSKRTRTPQGQSNCGSEQLQEEKSCDCVASVVSASVTVTTTSEGPIDCVWANRSLATHANNLGRDCAGEDRQVQSCKGEECPSCSTSDWSDWSPCTGPCSYFSSRSIRVREPLQQGICDQSLEEERACSCRKLLRQCPELRVKVVLPSGRDVEVSVPVTSKIGDVKVAAQKSLEQGFLKLVGPDGQLLNPSGEMLKCFKKLNTMKLGSPLLVSGTTGAPGSNASVHLHSGEETESKNVEEVPIDCQWADWHEWEACTKSCNKGITHRTRDILRPANSLGAECLGETRQTANCHEEPCPCDLGPWSDWSNCAGQADRAVRTREVLEKGNQSHCIEVLEQEKACACTQPSADGDDDTMTAADARRDERDGMGSPAFRRGSNPDDRRVSGALELELPDPVTFSSDPAAETAAQAAISELVGQSGTDLSTLAVSLMPAVNQNHTVDCWYSLVLPEAEALAVAGRLHGVETSEATQHLGAELLRLGLSSSVTVKGITATVTSTRT